MKLLATTNRYYLLLATLVFAVGSVVLYVGISLALRIEVDEQLLNQQREVMRSTRLKAGLLDIVALSAEPQPAGLRDTVLLDPTENVLVPYRQLSFRVAGPGPPQWVTLRKSLLETEDMVGLVLTVMLTVLGLLLLSLVWLNRWLARRIWSPFQHTLTALRGYDLQHQPVLALPPHTPIDEFSELNQALLQMSQRLEADYQSLKDFTENAAHETRTPLAIMQAKLEQLLQAQELRPATAELVGDLYSATVRLARLHQALTLLSKIENGQFPHVQPVQLDQVVQNRLRLLQDFIDDKELTVTSELRSRPQLRMHPALADSLVGNLLQNAIKHNHRGGGLHWVLTAEYLAISNTGPALAGEPARFFERFRKLNASSESPGLGLSIVQQIGRYYGYRVHYTFSAPDAVHTLRVEFGD
ncbi:sensor histidine kinase [Hymenobacter chitinivorans]|uniref:histidine kinase n=1 Tax=Hymenobacter chitinivorans DSM 11115 TaxID=1121954 RepID=A0A2M9BL84_9BACT|nr:HAMP domain-containing sensor histidine kinase [Hymenobacter chitinivorans]PJJ58703.1 signal transduction histidine kinase [Hymenobacter chitinivorans DSM 11115]